MTKQQDFTDDINLSFPDKVGRFVDDVFDGQHRVAKLRDHGKYWICIPRGTLATFDDDKLTRIVIASHKYGIRAEIDNNGMHGLKILLHNRTMREGRMLERHPSLRELFNDNIRPTKTRSNRSG